MRWLIFEDALKDKRGHYFEYISTFKHGLEACGDEVVIYTDRTAESWIKESLGSVPALPPSIWHCMSDNAPRWRRLLRYPWHGWGTFLAWRGMLNSMRRADVVFVPSVLAHHLCGIVPFLRLFGCRTQCTFLLFFPNTPIRHDVGCGEAVLNKDASAKMFRWMLRCLKPLVASGKVLLGVETRAMKEALEKIIDLPFHYLPHPVEAVRISVDAKSSQFPAREDEAIVIGSYGGCRFEKGSDILQIAARKYLQGTPDPRVRFAIQWTEDFADAADNPVTRDAWLQSHHQVTFISNYFDPAGGYASALEGTSVMLMPYRDAYRYRLSRVLIEAMIAGIPVAVSKETTLAEQAATHGASITFAQDSADAVAGAIKECVRSYGELWQEASSKAAGCAEHFSVKKFREIFIEAMRRAASSCGSTIHC